MCDQMKTLKLYPLTHPQKRIWYIEQIYPNTSMYNIGGPVKINGLIDFQLLERAIHTLIRAHDGLRMKLIETDGEISQYVSGYEEQALKFKDFSIFENPELHFNQWVEDQALEPFILNENLFEFSLFSISDSENGYLIKLHHLIADGWSINIITQQIREIYMKLLHGESITNEHSNSYLEYINQEQTYFKSDRFIKNKKFWNDLYKTLPEEFLNKNSDFTKGKRTTFQMAPQLSSKIKNFAKNNNVSLNSFFIFSTLIYQYKITHQRDLIIGTPVLNRSGQKEKSIIGMFTSTMPFRFQIDEKVSILDALKSMNRELMRCYFHQKYPYDVLMRDLQLQKNGYHQLFDTSVNYYNTKLETQFNDSQVENMEFYSGHQVYSLQLVIKDWLDSGRLMVEFDYKTSEYDEEKIKKIYNRLTILINQILVDCNEKVVNVNLLSNEEKKKFITDFNATESPYPKHKSIIQLFEEQVQKTPNHIAICFNKRQYSYNQLNQKVNQLARLLLNKGLQKESIVALLTHHSIESVISMLAVLKAGGAYMPIDPGYPEERITYMLMDSGCKLLLVNFEYSTRFNGKVINLCDGEIFNGDTSNIDTKHSLSDLAYVIYTSGSTGKPKGVMIEQQGLVNYIWWAKQMYVKDKCEVFPLYSSLAFDLTITSIFTPLISGGKIIVYRNDEDEYVLYKILNENQATVVKLTPSHLSLLKDMDKTNSSIQRFIVGGEDLSVSLSRKIIESFGGNVEIFNEYGPTETVVGCMIHKYNIEKDTKSSVPIGKPAHNVNIYILDPNLNPVPANEVGEMYISGDGVARGYLNREDLTKDRFKCNPFHSGKRMYKTGDMARFNDVGQIEYLGRSDHQVKVNGYRIELGEIEKQLLYVPFIKEAVVLNLKHENESNVLCAYFVSIQENITSNDLRNKLTGQLPDYMIPAYFVQLNEIPLTANGKVNRTLLPDPEIAHIKNTNFIPYRNETEQQLVTSLGEVLNIDKISMNDNFYHLGGDSIKAIQTVSKLKNQHFSIKVKDILSNPILEQMVKYMKKEIENLVDQSTVNGMIKNIPIVCWFLSHNFNQFNHYNQSVLLDLKQEISADKLEQIINELLVHHDSLRINVNSRNQMFYRKKEELILTNIEEFDLSNYSYDVQQVKMAEIGDQVKSGFNLEKDVLLKAVLFNLGVQGNRMLLTAHHLVMDGVSWRIILEDIKTLLNNISLKNSLPLPSKTYSLQAWAEMLWEVKDEFLKEKQYWVSILKNEHVVPVDFHLGEFNYGSSVSLSFNLDVDHTTQLLTIANDTYRTKVMDLLMIALSKAIFDTFNLSDTVIELEGHGRDIDHLDISRTVGWFTSLYPFKLSKSHTNLSDHIKTMKEQIRNIPNKGLGFGILKYLSQEIIDQQEYNRIRFNYLGDFEQSLHNDFFSLSSEDSGSENSPSNKLTALIDINGFVFNRKLNMRFQYCKNQFKDETIQIFMNLYMNHLKDVIQHCMKTESSQYTPSDFETIELSQDELDELLT
ncbi:non-ribosomal peptide synthetase [Chengkuizengella marina]|uniref:Amino acid adenylation domain-containing protein n=1 Tax=Chengkuizengella marina TaxID=2507566 RepID=A0A6N9Q0S6_9BACL|nr:non-ribosomal peptide synthetase [Chengkuizengella marina]NBI27594.1 amino acid adenylation domain-containing protein [Chengkuizengella marina]